MADYPTEPNCDQCAKGERLPDYEGRPTYACWYPQMGGYVARCAVVIGETLPGNDDPPCFEAYVWHDGQFPFEEAGYRSPAHLHHCGANQFIDFGRFVNKITGHEYEDKGEEHEPGEEDSE